MSFRGWDIGIDFKVDIYSNIKKVSYKRTWSTRWAKEWSEVKWYKLERVIEYEKTLNSDLLMAARDIAHLIKDYQIEYAPIDESWRKDDIVLKENIKITSDNWEFTVWTDNIPYATRRNYENNLHPDTKHYIENSWNNHVQEYEEILDDYAEEWADRLVFSMLEKSSGATSWDNRWYQRQHLWR